MTGEPSHHELPVGMHVADRRGLTALGAISVALAVGIIGGAIDVLTGPGLRDVFAVAFVLGCAAAAVLVHREDIFAAVVMPPLVYCVVALFAGTVEASGAAGGWLEHQTLELATALIMDAPVLMTAVGVAAVIAVGRVVTGARRAESPRPVPR